MNCLTEFKITQECDTRCRYYVYQQNSFYHEDVKSKHLGTAQMILNKR